MREELNKFLGWVGFYAVGACIFCCSYSCAKTLVFNEDLRLMLTLAMCTAVVVCLCKTVEMFKHESK